MPGRGRAELIIEEALGIVDGPGRREYLDRACRGDPDLRELVDVRLESRARAQTEDAPGPHPAHAPGAGGLIGGRYKLLEQIGEGGMGTVWLAEQAEPVRRRVALKLIKAGMDSKVVLARFEAERRALALMDHPNIARVLDGGATEQGRPFFVMEHVKGIPIHDYCDGARLTVEERLALFIPVCRAIQHAHRKGLIHRDLKPSNVLVCIQDGEPAPKVIDFGLAKALHQPLTDRTLLTEHGAMIGPPLYMSPEQAELGSLDVDARADIYSLGVMLYELLTGTTPVDQEQFRRAARQEMVRLIKEEEPERPSSRLSSSPQAECAATSRRTDPAGLGRLLKGELDWVVMKALDKDRSRRYETADALAEDIRRFLDREPVAARPASLLYRCRKYASLHRHRLATLPVLGLAALLLASRWRAPGRDADGPPPDKPPAAVPASEAAPAEVAGNWECEGNLPSGDTYRVLVSFLPDGRVLGQLGIERGGWESAGKELTISYKREDGMTFRFEAKLSEDGSLFAGRDSYNPQLRIVGRKQ